MKTRIILLIIISISFTMCNMTFFNHKDYRFRVKDFVWNTKIEGRPGHIYIEDSKIIFGDNPYSYLEISSENGAIMDNLKSFTVENEKEYDRLRSIQVDKQKYSGAWLKKIERQYRGDEETYYLIVKTLSNKEFKILFNRRHFFSLQDITFFKEGKYIIAYNGEAGYDTIPYHVHVGLLDLEKIIKK